MADPDPSTADAAPKKDAPPEGWYHWRTLRRACVELGIVPKEAERLLAELGEEPYHSKSDKTVRISNDAFEGLRSLMFSTSAREGETVTAAALRAAQGHAERMFRLFEGPIAQAQVRAEAEIARLTARVTELETELDANRQKNEAIQSEAHFRDLATKQLSAAEQRKADLVRMLMTKAPKLFDQVASTLAGGANREKLDAAIQLVQGLDPKLLGVLVDQGFVSAEQKLLIEKITGPIAQEKEETAPNVQTPASP